MRHLLISSVFFLVACGATAATVDPVVPGELPAEPEERFVITWDQPASVGERFRQEGAVIHRRVTVERLTMVRPSSSEEVEIASPGSVIYFSEEPRAVALGEPDTPTPQIVAEA